MTLLVGIVSLTATAGDDAKKSTPNRQAQFQHAKDLVAAAANASGTNSATLLADATKACDSLLWVTDDMFYRAVVLHARITFMRGDTQRAVRWLDGFQEVFDKISKAMIARGAETNDTPAHDAVLLRKDIERVSGKEKN